MTETMPKTEMNPMHRTASRLFLAALLAAPAFAQDGDDKKQAPAAEPTVQQIVAAANRTSYYQGRDGRADVKMVITDAQGQERVREMTILRRDEPKPGADEPKEGEKTDDSYCGEQKFYVRFHRPADVDKTTFLVWKKPGEDDNRWLYLPALDLVKPVSSADKRSSFVGSHFCYEDISGRHIAADEHTLVETSANYYVVESKPKDPQGVEFAAYKTWIHRKTFLVVKVEFRDDKDEVYRTYEVKGVKEIQGYQTVTEAVMTDHRTKGKTTVTYSNVSYDLGLPADIFTERYLRRAPRQWMR